MALSKSTLRWTIAVLILAALAWLMRDRFSTVARSAASPASASKSQNPAPANRPGLSEGLLAGYADPAMTPAEDLRKIHRLAIGYFSVVKDAVRHPIGGNEDFSAALMGNNPDREIFVRPANPVFSTDGQLVDRWGTPLIIHPEAWRQLEIRSAGPDKIGYNSDDLIIAPSGMLRSGE